MRADGIVIDPDRSCAFAHKHRAELAKALVGLEVFYPPFIT